jgi:RNA-directed DNA polymerase
MTVDALPLYLQDHWPSIRSQLLEGTDRPQPTLRATSRLSTMLGTRIG